MSTVPTGTLKNIQGKCVSLKGDVNPKIVKLKSKVGIVEVKFWKKQDGTNIEEYENLVVKEKYSFICSKKEQILKKNMLSDLNNIRIIKIN